MNWLGPIKTPSGRGRFFVWPHLEEVTFAGCLFCIVGAYSAPICQISAVSLFFLKNYENFSLNYFSNHSKKKLVKIFGCGDSQLRRL